MYVNKWSMNKKKQQDDNDLLYEPIIPPLELPSQTLPIVWIFTIAVTALLIGLGFLLIIYLLLVSTKVSPSTSIKSSQTQNTHPVNPPSPSPIPSPSPSPVPSSSPSPVAPPSPSPSPASKPIPSYISKCSSVFSLDCDIEALMKLKSYLPANVSSQLGSWDGSNPCNGWKGVRCSSPAGMVAGVTPQRVTVLDLGEGRWSKSAGFWYYFYDTNGSYISELQVEFPAYISQMTYLEKLILDRSGLKVSSIPPEISVLTHMKVFSLSDHQFTGVLPPQLSTWNNIQVFAIRENFVKGDLPVEYSTWQQLKLLQFSRNQFTGDLPMEYSNWKNIQVMDFSQNNFTGSVPEQYSLLLSSLSMFKIDPIWSHSICINETIKNSFLAALGSYNCDVYQVKIC